MYVLTAYAPWLAAMGGLIFASAFFSSSEAALFYLDRPQRRRLASGNGAQRLAAALVADSERTLTSVLFWNLVVNLVYFTIASIIALHLKEDGHAAEAGIFTVAALLLIIVFSEMLPKSLAVLAADRVAAVVSVPLAATARLLDPALPILRLANLLSRRLFWPRFAAEPYLRLGDLERAVELSTTDAALLEQEQTVLQNIVSLSGIRVDELMRPRTSYLSFHPPVSLRDLGGRIPPSGYLLVTELQSEEIAAAIALRDLSAIPTTGLEEHAQPVVYIPWCITAAEALEQMRRDRRQVAVVVNEFGETIGILTIDDVLETIFGRGASRTERILKQPPLDQVAPGTWHVSGMTSLRRLARHFHTQRPASKSVTVAGVIQEALERLPDPGDACRWGPFHFKVIDVTPERQLLVELTLVDPKEEPRP